MAMTLTFEDKKYLLRLNIEAGLEFSQAARNAGLTVEETQIVRNDLSFLESLPRVPTLTEAMKNVLSCVEGGSEFESALIIEGVTNEQAEFLRTDPAFQSKLARVRLMRNYVWNKELLDIKDMNKERGISTELRALLIQKDQDWAPKKQEFSISGDLPALVVSQKAPTDWAKEEED